MKKVLGYIIMIAGLALLALSFEQVRIMASLTLPASITDLYLMIGGIILILIGAAIGFRGGSGKQPVEVPIYRGNQVVGYRRTR